MKLFRTTIWLLYGVALFWVVFASLWLFQHSEYRYFYFIAGLGNAIVLSLIAYFLQRKVAAARWVGIFVLGANIMLTFADQIGWFDLAYLVPAIGLFVMLIKIRIPVADAGNTAQASNAH